MVRFFLERFFRALSAYRPWLLLAFVPVLIYLAVSAMIPDRFAVRQQISITGDDLILLSPKSGDLKAFRELVSTPKLFFLNKYALILLGKRLDMDLQSEQPLNLLNSLKTEVARCLSLHHARKGYGPDSLSGKGSEARGGNGGFLFPKADKTGRRLACTEQIRR